MKFAIFLLTLLSVDQTYAATGYATMYGGNLNGNACGMSGTAGGYNNWKYAAIGSSNFDSGYGCGKCYKITCTGPYGNNPSCKCGSNPTITVQAIDQCPECSASHFDLNDDALAYITGSASMAGTCGKISIKYERVDCTAITGNFYVKNKGGTSKYWYGFHLNDVNDDGGIKTVELYKSGSKIGYCTKDQGPSFWICTPSSGNFPDTPLSIKIKSDKGKSVTATNCITSYSGNRVMKCNTNLGGGGSSPVPSPTKKPTSGNSPPTKKPTSSGSSGGKKLKISNKKGLNQWWYAVTLENVPSAGISYLKMKGKGMSSWETGVKEWDYYKFTKNTPYSPPFAFKVKSKTGQVITTWNVIDSLNVGDSGYMNTAFNSAYTEADDDTDTTGFPAAGVVAIILVLCVIIAVGGYCFIKRRKQNAEVSFDTTGGDSDAPIQEGDDQATKTTSGYDMSPINTGGDTPVGDDTPLGDDDNDEAAEIEVDMEVTQN